MTPSPAVAQETKWNIEGSIGWDIGLSGDFIAAGIGTINSVPIVLQTQSFGAVYGTGVQWQIGAGYALNDDAEVRAKLHVSAERLGRGPHREGGNVGPVGPSTTTKSGASRAATGATSNCAARCVPTPAR